MYSERTQEETATLRKRLITGAVIACVLVVALFISMGSISSVMREQGAVSIRNTILNTSMQCAAVEGSFPTSLTYLEDNYGLRINHDDYVVTYEVFASNVIPSVVVVPR